MRKEGFEIVVIDTNDNLAVQTNTIVPNLNLYLFLNSSAGLPPSGFSFLDVVRTGSFLIAPPKMCAILPSSAQAPAQLRLAELASISFPPTVQVSSETAEKQ